MNNPFKFEKKVISVLDRTMVIEGRDNDMTGCANP